MEGSIIHVPGITISSVQSSCSVMSNSLWLHEPQHTRPVHHRLPEFTQTHVHWVGDANQPSQPLSSPSPPAFNLSQHQGLFKWVSSSHQLAKVSLYMFKIFLSLIQQMCVCVCVCVCVCASHVQLFAVLWAVACQEFSLSMEFSRQEH